MERIIADQTRIFLLAAVMGLGLGFVYDVLRAVGRALRRGRGLRAAMDIAFCLVGFLALLWFMLAVGKGEFRGYIPLGAGAGMTLYFLALSGIMRAWLVPGVQMAGRALAGGRRAVLWAFSYPRGS